MTKVCIYCERDLNEERRADAMFPTVEGVCAACQEIHQDDIRAELSKQLATAANVRKQLALAARARRKKGKE